jgi:hypothetical protein
MTDTRTTVPEAGHLVALWAGVLLAPTAFLLNLELGYLAVPASCTAGGTTQLLHLIHGGCLLVAIAGAGIAWLSWSRTGTGWPGEAGGPTARSRFMAGLGVAGSALFALTIVAQWIPTLTLHPCQ